MGLFVLIGVFFVVTKEPRHYTAEEWKAFSIEEANKRLDQYVEQEKLNRADFTGPYFKKSGYDPRGKTYTTCFKSETDHVCYHQVDHSHEIYKYDENCNGYYLCEWLIQQP